MDELLRAIGTIVVSTGMLLLLYGVASTFAQVLLLLALVCFVLAFIYGRRYDIAERRELRRTTINDTPEAMLQAA